MHVADCNCCTYDVTYGAILMKKYRQLNTQWTCNSGGCSIIIFIQCKEMLYHYCVFQIPAPLNQYLRDYQQLGAQFIYDHYMMNQGVTFCMTEAFVVKHNTVCHRCHSW